MFEGIDPSTLGAVRALARELRYASLPVIVDRRVRLGSVSDVERVVRSAVAELESARLANEELQMSLTLAKYGILDLRFEVDSITAGPIGFAGLQELGFVDREAAEEKVGWEGVLSDWVDECRRAQPLVRLFLAGPSPRDVIPEWKMRGGWRGELLGDHLPQELTITDACETNGAFVWLAKHLYL